MIKLLIPPLLIIAAIFVAWKVYYPSGSWRYKVTVEIETPEGVKSGSAVHELSVGTPMMGLPDVGNPASIRGEAVVVDLGKRGVVFALMSDQSWQNGIYQAFPTEAPSSKRGIEYYRRTLKPGMAGDWKDNQPIFVTFADTNKPKSVKLVLGGHFNKETQKIDPVDDFEEIFGVGVKLKGITVEMTDDPITETIHNILKWLPTLKGGYIDGQFLGGGPHLSNILHGGNFRKGEKQ